ncbi:MAG: propanediol/glycerol family dehydratase large subunit [Caldilineaceae bacterium]
MTITTYYSDMQVDGGVRPITEEEALTIRLKRPAPFRPFTSGWASLPYCRSRKVEAAVYAHSSDEMPERDLVADLAAADAFLESDRTMLTIVDALEKAAFHKTAQNILTMGKQRVAGDYLQPSAIFDKQFRVRSGINDVNDYIGPGTGYRLDDAAQKERWAEIQRLPQVQLRAIFIADQIGEPMLNLPSFIRPKKAAAPKQVGVGPAFGKALTRTINGLEHADVLAAIDGVAKEGSLAAWSRFIARPIALSQGLHGRKAPWARGLGAIGL